MDIGQCICMYAVLLVLGGSLACSYFVVHPCPEAREDVKLGVCLGVCAHSYRQTITKTGANFQFCFTLLGAPQELEPSQPLY